MNIPILLLQHPSPLFTTSLAPKALIFSHPHSSLDFPLATAPQDTVFTGKDGQGWVLKTLLSGTKRGWTWWQEVKEPGIRPGISKCEG